MTEEPTKGVQLVSDLAAEKHHLLRVQRHFLLCIGPSCCSTQEGNDLWDYLKLRLREANLADDKQDLVYRSKVGCLRICGDGPIGLVYPEGTWYRRLDKKAIDRIISEHLINGNVVKEYQFSETRLVAPFLPLESK
jgi:(2Fe-2S) ferredoxin